MGKIIPLPDCEYKYWCNINKEYIEGIIRTGRVPTMWLGLGNNKIYLERYFKERGYTFSLD